MADFVENSTENYKLLAWLEQYMMGNEGFIAGGCFKNILLGEKVKDLDMFFPHKDEFIKVRHNMLADKERYKKVYETPKSTGILDTHSGIRLDLVSSIYGSPEEVLRRFDFTIVQFAYYHIEEFEEEDDNPFNLHKMSNTHTVYKILHHKDFFEHLLMKRLVIDKEPGDITFPVSTFDRTLRYAKYGYKPCRETKAKLVSAIQGSEVQDSEDVSRSLYDGMD